MIINKIINDNLLFSFQQTAWSVYTNRFDCIFLSSVRIVNEQKNYDQIWWFFDVDDDNDESQMTNVYVCFVLNCFVLCDGNSSGCHYDHDQIEQQPAKKNRSKTYLGQILSNISNSNDFDWYTHTQTNLNLIYKSITVSNTYHIIIDYHQ